MLLELVPPTVERPIEGQRGSLQLWTQGLITEGERLERGLEAPDREAWNRRMYDVRRGYPDAEGPR